MPNASPPVVAAFDLDGTLTDGGSVFKWLEHVAGRGVALRAAARLVVPLTLGALRSGRTADHAKERLFRSLLAGREWSTVERASRTFILEHLQRHLRSQTVARLRWHLDQGHEVVLVSASPEVYVDIVAGELGAHGALGTRLAVDPLGRLTGGYLGRNCRGKEKMRRLEEWIDSRGYPAPPDVYAYGNSRGDRRLLSRATYPFNLGRLGRWGALRRYPSLPLTTE